MLYWLKPCPQTCSVSNGEKRFTIPNIERLCIQVAAVGECVSLCGEQQMRVLITLSIAVGIRS